MKTNTLFTPLELGAVSLRNRIVMAPTTRMRAKMPGNIPWKLNATYYRQRASAGLIITEATPVSQRGHGYFHMPGIHTTAQADGWKLVTNAVHEAGGTIFLQLFHAGRMSHNDFQPNGELPVAPSAISSNGQSPVAPAVLKNCPVPRALETSEIAGVIEEHKRAAELAKTAGFDGVEIHAANGYLLEQFLSDHANVRTDKYGGHVANRARLILEVTEAVASIWQGSRVGIRFSPANAHDGIAHTDRFSTYAFIIHELNRFQLAYIHLIEPRVAGNSEAAQFDATLNSRNFKPLITGDTKLISNGGHTFASGTEAVQSGEADAIAWGRQFIANPDLVERFLKNAPLNRYDRETFYGGSEKGYTDYPFLAQGGAAVSKALSLFLGVLMFVFGFLKFFQPFRGWFEIQIRQSHLPDQAILAGKLGEMVTACLFLLPWLQRSSTAKYKDQLLLVACAMLVSQMVVAIYVHLQPQVPANVLPLGIKPPVIPFVVLLLALLTAFAVWKKRREG